MKSTHFKKGLVLVATILMGGVLFFGQQAHAALLLSQWEPPTGQFSAQFNHTVHGIGFNADYTEIVAPSGIAGVLDADSYLTCYNDGTHDGATLGVRMIFWDVTSNTLLASSTPTTINCQNPNPPFTLTPEHFDFSQTPWSIPAGDTMDIMWNLAVGDTLSTQNVNIGYQTSAGQYSFSLYDTEPLLPPAPQLYFSGDGTASSSIPDFTNWLVNLGGSYSFSAQVGVSYSRSSSTVGTGSAFIDYGPLNSVLVQPYRIAKSNALWYPPLVQPVTWYAKAFYLDHGTFLFGPLQTFTVNTGASNTIPPFPSSSFTAVQTNIDLSSPQFGANYQSPSSTSIDCSAYQFIDTSGIVPWFASTSLQAVGCTMKQVGFDVLQWLFVPPASVISSLQNQVASFSNVIPFSVIASVRDSVASTTAAASPSDLNVEFNGEVFPDASGTIASANSLRDAMHHGSCDLTCANAQRDLVFNVFRSVIWLGWSAKIIAMVF